MIEPGYDLFPKLQKINEQRRFKLFEDYFEYLNDYIGPPNFLDYRYGGRIGWKAWGIIRDNCAAIFDPADSIGVIIEASV